MNVRARIEPLVLRWIFRQRWLFAIMRRRFPVLRLGRRVWVTRHEDVRYVLGHDREFGIVYRPRMKQLGVPFLLGMDDSPPYREAHAALSAAVRPEDVPWVRRLSAERADALLAAAGGGIDVVGGLIDPVLSDTVPRYFGVGVDLVQSRAIFRDIFLNKKDPLVTERARAAVATMRAAVDEAIAARSSSASRATDPNGDVLGRLLQLKGESMPWLNDEEVRNNLLGLILGWVPNVSRTAALAIDELLDPDRAGALADAACAARACEDELVEAYVLEALRFRPPGPALERRCVRETRIGKRKAKLGDTVLAVLCSAMLDENVFGDPLAFSASRRPGDYLHFGYGLHRCFGESIARAQIGAVVAALLRQGDLRRAGRLKFDGPLPSELMVDLGRRRRRHAGRAF